MPASASASSLLRPSGRVSEETRNAATWSATARMVWSGVSSKPAATRSANTAACISSSLAIRSLIAVISGFSPSAAVLRWRTAAAVSSNAQAASTSSRCSGSRRKPSVIWPMRSRSSSTGSQARVTIR
jgi:hypothetical protein